MKKFFFLFLLLAAMPAMADLTCKTTEGCTSSNPAKDCEALGYDAKTSLDKDCEHSLQCPFSKDYAKCVKWKDQKIDYAEACKALGFENQPSCPAALWERCPFEGYGYYAKCKNQTSSCQALGFVEQESYIDMEDHLTKYYLPYCWDQVNCTDDTGIQHYALCVKGEYMPLCSYWEGKGGNLCPDDDSESDFNTRVVKVKGAWKHNAFTTAFITPLLKGGVKCIKCGRCLDDLYFVGYNDKDNISKGNLLALKEGLETDRYTIGDHIITYCSQCGDTKTTSFNITEQDNDDKLDLDSVCRTPDNPDPVGPGGGSGGDSGGSEGSYSLCNCDVNDYVDKNGHCQKSSNGAIAQVYFVTTELNLVEYGGNSSCSIGEENCYVKAAALSTTTGNYTIDNSQCVDATTKTAFSTIEEVYRSWRNSRDEDELYNMFYTTNSKAGQLKGSLWYGGGRQVSSFSVENDLSDWHWYIPTILEIWLSGKTSHLSDTPAKSSNSSGSCGVWASDGLEGSNNKVSGQFYPHVLLYQGCTPKNGTHIKP